jgi:catechol 2,3-dioxygenase-like lactoylglutathione lyase family enzyme
VAPAVEGSPSGAERRLSGAEFGPSSLRTPRRGRYGGLVAAIRLDQVNLVVHDVPASRAFYARLGLQFRDVAHPDWDAHHVSARHNETTPLDVDLDSESFASKLNSGWSGGSRAILGFKVESRDEVDTLVASLASEGVTVQQAPYDAFWGARYAVVSDPDGNGVGIMSPIDPARRSETPSLA